MKKLFLIALAFSVSGVASADQITLDWTRRSDSVQGMLHSTLYAEAVKNAERGYSNSTLKYKFGKVTLNDGHNSVACEAKSFGMTPVQSYKCKFSFESQRKGTYETALETFRTTKEVLEKLKQAKQDGKKAGELTASLLSGRCGFVGCQDIYLVTQSVSRPGLNAQTEAIAAVVEVWAKGDRGRVVVLNDKDMTSIIEILNR